jgi:diaminopimelate epimerase
MPIAVAKAHAYGNDFLLVPETAAPRSLPDCVRTICDRHHGLGADGVILYTMRQAEATMQLFNADGSASELSGNGLRCLAALVVRTYNTAPGTTIAIQTDAGMKQLDVLARDGERYTFRAAMGVPEDIRQVTIVAGGETVTATVLRTGNPQCVVLGPLPDVERFNRLGPALATHAMFPAGTNVEFAQVDTPHSVSILIWERGVGPTTSSGTGSCATAVAAAAHGGAARDVDVIAPGGLQSVEWRDEGVFLTGWAEMLFEGQWLGA